VVHVLILGRNLELKGVPQVLFRGEPDGDQVNAIAWQLRHRNFDNFDRQLGAIADQTDSLFISKIDLVCPRKKCWVVLNGQFAFIDSNHFSLAGIRRLGELLVQQPEFRAALN
jgi:hypothetical protein